MIKQKVPAVLIMLITALFPFQLIYCTGQSTPRNSLYKHRTVNSLYLLVQNGPQDMQNIDVRRAQKRLPSEGLFYHLKPQLALLRPRQHLANPKNHLTSFIILGLGRLQLLPAC